MTAAEILTRAAELLRETAAGATRGPWGQDGDHLTIGGLFGYRVPIEGTFLPPDPAWIALMSPALGEPLAAWLEAQATWMKQGIYVDGSGHFHSECGDALDEDGDCGCFFHPLAIARAVLGEDGAR